MMTTTDVREDAISLHEELSKKYSNGELTLIIASLQIIHFISAATFVSKCREEGKDGPL